MKKILIPFLLNLLIPSIGFCCAFEAAFNVPFDYTELPQACISKINAYIDRDGPVKQPYNGKCNNVSFECNINDKLSECDPCIIGNTYAENKDKLINKYTELCENNASDILMTACNEIFKTNTSDEYTQQQALAPESIEAPVFNSIDPEIRQQINERLNELTDLEREAIQNINNIVEQTERDLRTKCSQADQKDTPSCEIVEQTIQKIKDLAQANIEEILQI